MRSYILDSLDELKDHRESWESLRLECKTPIFTSYDLVRLWLESFSGIVSPQVIVIEEEGDLVGLAPLSVYRYRAAGLPMRTLTVVGNGKNTVGYSLLSVIARGDSPDVLQEMVRVIKRARWNLLQLTDLEPVPSTVRLLERLRLELDWQPHKETNNMFYDFPAEGDIMGGFGRHTRKVLRHTRRVLEREGRMEVRLVRTVDGAEGAMRLYVRQHMERWANKGGSMFQDERNARHLVEMGKLAIGTDMGMIYEMLIDDEVAAQAFMLYDGDLVRGYRIGMIDKFREHSPGKLMMMLAMEDLRARGYKGIDLLRGTEAYKYHMMTRERTLPAIQAQRGALQLLSKIRAFPPVRMLDERLGMRERVLRRVYRG